MSTNKPLLKYKNSGLIFLNPEKLKSHEKDFFPLLAEERAKEMNNSIGELGVLQPALITKNFEIISGKNRVESCAKQGVKVPCIRFLEEIPTEILRRAIMHTNNVRRSNSDSDRKLNVFKQYKDWLGKEATLSYIAKDMGVSLSLVKKWHTDFKNREKQKSPSYKISEEDLKKGRQLYIRMEKILDEIRDSRNKYEVTKRELEKIAPVSYWSNLRKQSKSLK